MLKRFEWLTTLWVREWNYWEKHLVRQLRVELLCLVAVFLLFVANKALSGSLSAYIMSAPEEMRAFWGLSENVTVGNSIMFLRWAIMPLNVWVAWKSCYLAVQAVWREEDAGSIFTLCNQWYNRYQIGIAKCTWVGVNFVINYTILFAAITALALLGNDSGAQKAEELGIIWGIYLKGIVVILFLIALSGCRALLRARKKPFVWVEGLVLGSLAVGNFYKLVDLLAFGLRRMGRNDGGVLRWLGWSSRLRWLSPLSWLNPFTEFGVGETVLQIIVCVIVSAGAVGLGLLGFRVRRLERYRAEGSIE